MRTPVLTIAARKGGVGKSFAAINASVLAACGGPDKDRPPLRVLLIDVDSQQNTTYYFLKYLGCKWVHRKALLPANPNCEDKEVYNITDIFMGNDFVEYPTQYGNLFMIPSDGEIDDLRKEFNKFPEKDIVLQTTNQFKKLIKLIEDDFDLIIIDTPPSKTHASQAAVAVSTHVLVMAELDIWNSENGLPGIMSDIEYVNSSLRNNNDPVEIIGICPNKISSKAMTNEERKTLADLIKRYPSYLHKNLNFFNRVAFKTTTMPEDPSCFAYMKQKDTADQMRKFYNHISEKVLADIYASKEK
jgi:chromosome partitioning protein|tara:strand:+ start:273 stop:1175 length:903 start_codon:yes stop_codon:yes gene_type:complete